MAIDNRGIIWLATTDGLLRYDLERVQRTALGPYTSTEIRAVAAMQDGQLWLSTSTEGLLYYEEESQSYTAFELDSGLPSTVGAYRCLSRSQDGRIWVGTAEGTVYSRDLRPTSLPTQAPQFMQIRSGRKILAPEAEEPLRLKSQAQLSLHWACPTFPAGRVTYRYRLRGTPDSSSVQVVFRTGHNLGPRPGIVPLLLPAKHHLCPTPAAGFYQLARPFPKRLPHP